MRKNLLKVFVLIGMFLVCGGIAADAQSNVIGKYNYKDKTTEGNPLNSSLEFKSENIVIFTYVSTADGYDTETRTGTWALDKAKNSLTVKLPAVTENQVKGDDVKQTYLFKTAGKNLKFVKSLYEDNLVGDLYQKL